MTDQHHQGLLLEKQTIMYRAEQHALGVSVARTKVHLTGPRKHVEGQLNRTVDGGQSSCQENLVGLLVVEKDR